MFPVYSLENNNVALSLLSEREKRDYNKVPSFKQRDWLVGRYSAKKVVQDYFLNNENKSIDLNKIEIISNPFQKPIFKLLSETKVKTNISISQCDVLGVAAIDESEKEGLVGVDIERIRNFKKNILHSFLTPKELAQIEKANPAEKIFLPTLVWSFKESYLKALGLGLTHHPKHIELVLDLPRNDYQLYDKDQKINTKMAWKFFDKSHVCTKINIFEQS